MCSARSPLNTMRAITCSLAAFSLYSTWDCAAGALSGLSVHFKRASTGLRPTLVWWLTAAAAGPNAYASLQWFMETLLGRLILFGYTWALIHHMLGGIKHLIWDLGYGFGPAEREWLTVATLVGSVGFTILLWLVGYLLMGGIR